MKNTRGQRYAIYCSNKCCKSDPIYIASHIAGCTKWKQKTYNKLEKLSYALFETLGYTFEKQYLMHGKFCVDAYFADFDVVVQIDGDYWHGNMCKFHNLTERQIFQKKKDKSIDNYLKTAGHTVIRFWETDIKKNPEKCLDILAQTFKGIENDKQTLHDDAK